MKSSLQESGANRTIFNLKCDALCSESPKEDNDAEGGNLLNGHFDSVKCRQKVEIITLQRQEKEKPVAAQRKHI